MRLLSFVADDDHKSRVVAKPTRPRIVRFQAQAHSVMDTVGSDHEIGAQQSLNDRDLSFTVHDKMLEILFKQTNGYTSRAHAFSSADCKIGEMLETLEYGRLPCGCPSAYTSSSSFSGPPSFFSYIQTSMMDGDSLGVPSDERPHAHTTDIA